MPRRHHDLHKKNYRLVTDYLHHGQHKDSVKFTLHHRKRYCLGGKSSAKNCVLVDIESHQSFNALVFVAGRLCNIPEKFVRTVHIAMALNRITQIFDYAMTTDIKAISVADYSCDKSKDVMFNLLVAFTSALKHVKKKNVTHEHLEYAAMKVRLISRIIAGSRNRLIRPDRLVNQFNSIWLPKDDPIHYGYWAEKKKKKHHK